MKVGYYPGCSLESTAWEYNDSIKDICKTLDVELREIMDWNCCGATSAHCIDEEASFMLSVRNLEIAEKEGLDIAVPCSGCFSRLKFAEKNALHNERFKDKSSFSGEIQIHDILTFLNQDEILKRIEKNVKNPLKGLKAAAYYGCMSLRPPAIVDSTDHENPLRIENIMDLLGIEVIDWSFKTVCCGGGLALSRTDIAKTLIYKIFSMAEEAGTDCLVTSCPMCQANLDSRMHDVSADFAKNFQIPVFYISELMGLAFGSRRTGKWFRKHLVNPKKILKMRGLV